MDDGTTPYLMHLQDKERKRLNRMSRKQMIKELERRHEEIVKKGAKNKHHLEMIKLLDDDQCQAYWRMLNLEIMGDITK